MAKGLAGKFIPNDSGFFHHSKVTKEMFGICLAANKLTADYSKCCICDWGKTTIDWAHIVPRDEGGDYTYKNIIPLCLNHHRLFDNGLLTTEDAQRIYSFIESILAKVQENS